jgi:hypothetical protein
LGKRPKNAAALEALALELMADIVPHEPVSEDFAEVSADGGLARWGHLFGDAEIAAVVAVGFTKESTGVDLCLLRWEGAWKLTQWIGRTPTFSFSGSATAGTDWAIRQHVASHTFYVVGGLSTLYAPRDHPSWLCDPKTHTLAPTGWRDAIPLVNNDIITFTFADKPGYSTEYHKVHRFKDGKPDEWLGTWWEEGHQPNIVMAIAVPRKAGEKPVTWRVRKSKKPAPRDGEAFALCRSENDKEGEPFREDATMECYWEGLNGWGFGIVLRRLLGLKERTAPEKWDWDYEERAPRWGAGELHPPLKRVTVTGLPEAVEKFSWDGKGDPP